MCLQRSQMARRTFFSLHYKADVLRSWIVRNSWVTKVAKGSRESAGFFESSVFEATQRESDDSLKRFLREGLNNTSVTCVLVGEHTALRRWVRYEILRSFACGNGLLAVRRNTIPAMKSPPTPAGDNPFNCLAFTVEGDRVRFRELMTSGWEDSGDVGSMPLNKVRYDLGDMTNHTLACLFPVFDWHEDDGTSNLGNWIEAAARQAGR
jgi:hypothetical protein